MDDEPTTTPRRRSARGCLRTGCLALLLLSLVPPVLLWAISRELRAADAGVPRHVVREHRLPALAADDGTIRLAVEMAELSIEPGPAGSPLRLQADWDPGRFRLVEGLERDGAGWSYRLALRGRGLRTWLPAGSRGGLRGPRLRLSVPADRRFALRGEVGMGESSLELGGLALAEIDLRLSAGQHLVSFAAPTTLVCQRLRLRSSMGELEVLRAGNASPRAIDLAHRMGELRLDLGGAWRNDGRVDLALGMGSFRVTLPGHDEAGSVVEEGRMVMGSRQIDDLAESELPAGLPRVRIRAQGGMGDLVIR